MRGHVVAMPIWVGRLFEACFGNDGEEVVKILEEVKQKHEQSLATRTWTVPYLIVAVFANAASVVDVLLERGASLNSRISMYDFLRRGQVISKDRVEINRLFESKCQFWQQGCAGADTIEEAAASLRRQESDRPIEVAHVWASLCQCTTPLDAAVIRRNESMKRLLVGKGAVLGRTKGHLSYSDTDAWKENGAVAASVDGAPSLTAGRGAEQVGAKKPLSVPQRMRVQLKGSVRKLWRAGVLGRRRCEKRVLRNGHASWGHQRHILLERPSWVLDIDAKYFAALVVRAASRFDIDVLCTVLKSA